MKQKKYFFSMILAFLLIFTMAIPTNVQAAAKPKLSATKVTLEVGKTKKLAVKNTKNKMKWTSDNKKVATVSSSGTVKAIDKGKTKIKAYDKKTKKTYTCTVTVKRKSFPLYNGKSETKVVPTGCTTYSTYSIRKFLENKGDKISSSAKWTSSDETILSVLENGKYLRTLEFGKVTLTVKSGSKTFIYDVDVVEKNPYALTYEDFELQNVVFDTNHIEIIEGKSTNFIDIYPTISENAGVSYWYKDEDDKKIELYRGIKIGDSLKDLYKAYGFLGIGKAPADVAGYNDATHTATSRVVLHYGIKDKNICYQIGLIFDQNDKLMSVSMAPHTYHGK